MEIESAQPARPGTAEPLHQLLVDVLGRLARGPQGSAHPRHDELAILIERVQDLDETGLAELEHAAVTLRGPLLAVRAPTTSAVAPELTKQQRLTLRTSLRALRAILENVELGGAPCRLRSAQLAMAYGTVDVAALVDETAAPFEAVARDLAEHASQVKSNFLRMMSHELRTPVTAMHLHIHVLKQDPEIASSKKLREGFDRVNQSSQRLLQLVNTVFEWARVESNRVTLTLEEVDLWSVARDVVTPMIDVATRKKVGLELMPRDERVTPPLISDRRLISLIAQDLVSRALQSTEKGNVTVRVWQDGERHVLSVRDQAPRITPRMLEELFEPLSSSKGLRFQGGGGSGLGLFVVRDLARAIDGEISLEPWDEVGNTLSVRFPTMPVQR
jgi:signal transduction histidine kinase